MKPLYPLPEAIRGARGKGWKIAPSSSSVRPACTAPESRQMIVPVGDRCPLCDVRHDHAVRVHEMAHARWSPSRPEAGMKAAGVTFADCLPVEETRVALLLSRRADLGTLPNCLCEWDAIRLARTSLADSLHTAVDAVLSCIGSSDFPALEAAFAGALPKYATRAADALRLGGVAFSMLDRSKLSWADTCRVARFVRDAVDALEPESGGRRRLPPGAHAEDGIGPLLTGVLDRAAREGDGEAQWGELTIEETRRELPVRATTRPRKRARDMGAALTRPDRLCTDGRIFSERRPWSSGTVLVDVSGSMHLSTSEVARIVNAAPAGALAIYAAGDDGRGVLRVVARRGRRVPSALLDGLGNLNVVDGPALRWLAEQPAPRVWVSDGNVTGVGPSGSGEVGAARLSLDAAAVCRRAGIRRVDSPTDVPAVIRALRP